MQGYKKVLKEKQKTEENEIRVTAKGQIKKQLGYALRIFNQTEFRQLEIRGTGNAIVKALILIELVKRRVGDLHQINTVTSTEIVDEFEPQVEGLEKIEQRRRVTCLNCILSKDPLDTTDVGYQEPVAKEVREERPPTERKEQRYNDSKQTPGGVQSLQEFIRKEGGAQRGNRGRGAPRRQNDPTPIDLDDRPQGRGRGGYGPKRYNDYEPRRGNDRPRYNDRDDNYNNERRIRDDNDRPFRGGQGRGVYTRGAQRVLRGSGRGASRGDFGQGRYGDNQEGGFRGGYRRGGYSGPQEGDDQQLGVRGIRSGYDRPYRGRGGFRGGENRESQGFRDDQGEERPFRPQGEDRPFRPQGEDRPFRPQGEDRPFRPQGEFRGRGEYRGRGGEFRGRGEFRGGEFRGGEFRGGRGGEYRGRGGNFFVPRGGPNEGRPYRGRGRGGFRGTYTNESQGFRERD